MPHQTSFKPTSVGPRMSNKLDFCLLLGSLNRYCLRLLASFFVQCIYFPLVLMQPVCHRYLGTSEPMGWGFGVGWEGEGGTSGGRKVGKKTG